MSSPTAARSVVSHQLHGLDGQAGACQGLAHQLPQGQVGLDGLRAATQDAGVAALDGQGRRLDGDVGAALVNHAEHAQGDAHLAHADAGGTALDAGHLADGIGHGGQLFAALGHGVDDFPGQAQAVHHGRGQSRRLGGGDVAGVGFRQRGAGLAQQAGKLRQGVILGPGGGAGHGGRGRAGLLAQGPHVGLDVHLHLRKAGNGKRETGNGKRETGNGKRETGNA
jgi:hypothetical protein